jgi:hypothetical protein
MDLPSQTRAGFTKRAFQRFCRTGGGKQVASIIAAIYDVVNGARKLEAKSTCHRASKIAPTNGTRAVLPQFMGNRIQRNCPIRARVTANCNM